MALDLATWATDLIVYGGLAYFLFLVGGVLVLLSRPPKWLVPEWLIA
jgi:hypothetical protein